MNKLALILAAAVLGTGSVLAADAPADNSASSAGPFVEVYPPPALLSGFSAYHLTPEDSPLAGGSPLMDAEYYRLLLWAFDKAFDRDVMIRAVVLPSFQPEYAVGIRSGGKGESPVKYTVFFMRPKIQYWQYVSPDVSPHDEIKIADGDTLNKFYAAQGLHLTANPRDVPVDRCEKPIDESLAKRIAGAWIAVLGETRYNRPGEAGGFIPNDGTTYHFSAAGGLLTLAGQTLATGLAESAPELLTKLADSLVAYCDGTATEADLSAQVDALTKELKP